MLFFAPRCHAGPSPADARIAPPHASPIVTSAASRNEVSTPFELEKIRNSFHAKAAFIMGSQLDFTDYRLCRKRRSKPVMDADFREKL
ncbi:MAG: hypothetical protein LC098_07030 [Burkholderiales bacterium]|nr:hypothetical protein [Burkholderiales bacterium]